MNFGFIRQPCFIILSLFPQNISILTKSSKSSAEVAKNDLGTKNKNTSQEADQTENSIWGNIRQKLKNQSVQGGNNMMN